MYFKLIPNPQKTSRSKKGKNGPKWAQIKNKKIALYSKPKLTIYMCRSQNYFWTWSHFQKKKTQHGPKSANRLQIGQNKNKKIKNILPKPKFIWHMSRSQESFRTHSQPPKRSTDLKKGKKAPNGAKLELKRYDYTSKTIVDSLYR